MAYISDVVLVDGSTYDLKDKEARALISTLQGYTDYLGVTDTPLADGSTTSSIVVNNVSITAQKGSIVNYGSKELIFDGIQWREFGDLSALKALAFKDNVSGSYTPTGSVSQPTFSGTSMNSTGSFTPSGSVEVSVGEGTPNYTPAGSVSVNTEVSLNTDSTYSMTGVGTLPSLSTSVSGETLTLSFDPGTLPTRSSKTFATSVNSASSTGAFTGTGVKFAGTFSGNSGQVSVSGTPSGTVSQPTFTGNQATIQSS